MAKWIPCNMDWCKHNINRYCCAPNPPTMEWEHGPKRDELKKPFCSTYEDGEVEDE